MRRPPILAALAGLLLLPAVPERAAAQDDATAFVYGGYYQCGAGQGRAVEVIRDAWAPVVRPHIEAGHITAWGLLTHRTGNQWSMALYHVSDDVSTLQSVLEEMVQQFVSENPDAAAEFREACPTHEDYIWTTGPGSVAGTEIAQNRPSAGLSTYWVCDEGREAVADLIVEKVYGPLYDKEVEEGRLNSWNWFSHFVGGKYRRLLVMDGTDHASLLEARGNVIQATNAANAALAAEFSNVCNGHQDVLWDIAISEP